MKNADIEPNAWTATKLFAIVGYVPFLGERGKIGSLILGLRDEEGAFHFAGTVRRGLTGTARVHLGALLERDHIKAATALDAPCLGNLKRWTSPKYVAEVKCTTPDGHGMHMDRHAAFLRLRKDKRPDECVQGTPRTVRRFPLTDSGMAGLVGPRDDLRTRVHVL